MDRGVWFKPAEGANVLRILPTPEGAGTPDIFWEYFRHREVGPKARQVRCGYSVEGGKNESCWLCDTHIPELIRRGKGAVAKTIAKDSVFIVQVAEYLPGEDMFVGPYLWTPGKKLAKAVLGLIQRTGKRDYVSPKDGYNFVIRRRGTGRFTTEYDGPEPEDDKTTVSEDILAKMLPFGSYTEIPVYSVTDQENAVRGIDRSNEDDEVVSRPRGAERRAESSYEDEDDDIQRVSDERESRRTKPAAEPPAAERKASGAVSPRVTKAKPPAPAAAEEDDEDDAPPSTGPSHVGKSGVPDEDEFNFDDDDDIPY